MTEILFARRDLLVGGPNQGIGASHDNAVARWDGVNASTVQDSLLFITDSGTISGSGYLAGIAHFNGSGLITSSAIDLASIDVAGILPPLRGGTGITALGTGIAAWLATPSSANLAAALTDETGTGPAVFANSPAISTPSIVGGSITGLALPTSSTDAATKGYVDSVAVGSRVGLPVRLTTVAALSNTPTYDNGTAGVGATLTGGSNGALSVDGTAVIAGDRLLVKDQASALQNGVYTVTATGSGGAVYVLTRVTDFDQAAEMLVGTSFLVQGGATLNGSTWVLTGTVTTVGTTAASFNQSAAANAGVLSFNGRTGTITPATNDYSVAQVLGAAPLASPSFSGVPLAPTAATATNTTQIATAGYVKANLADAANISGGTLPDARLANTISAGGPIGDSTHIPVITYDAHGRLTAVATALVSGITQWTSASSDIYFTGGKVGIGSSSAPQFDLDINRDVNSFLVARIYNPSSGSGAYSELALGNNTAQYLGQLIVTSGANSAYGGPNSLNLLNTISAPLTFGTNNLVRVTIDSSGMVQYNTYGAGTITADTTGHLKSSRVYYSAAYGMVGDGVTANDTAWAALIAAYTAAPGPIVLAPGKFVFTGAASIAISTTMGASITGAGANSSILVFTGATNGLVINYSGSGRWFNGSLSLQDFGVQTTQTDPGTGIQITGGVIGASPGAPTFIKNVHVYSDASPHRWSTGLLLTSVSRVTIDGFFYDGDNVSFDHGTGIQITSPSIEAVEYMFTGLDINYASIGIYVTGHIQGVSVVNSNITAVTTGVAWDTAILEPQFTMSNSQISATNRAMVLNNLAQTVISGNLFYAIGTPDLAAIYMSNSVDTTISNNTFELSPNVNGIVFASGTNNNIVSGNLMRGSGTGVGIWLQTGTTGNSVLMNQISGWAAAVLDDGTGNNANLGTTGMPIGQVFAKGYASRSGTTGSFGANAFNLFWTGSNTHLYIDSSDQGAISMVSDMRFKNLLPSTVEDAVLRKVASLDFFRFRYKNLGIMRDDGVERHGMSAAQLQRLFPSTVNGAPDALDERGTPIPQTINPPELLPIALRAIKELSQRMDRLEAKLDTSPLKDYL